MQIEFDTEEEANQCISVMEDMNKRNVVWIVGLPTIKQTEEGFVVEIQPFSDRDRSILKRMFT